MKKLKCPNCSNDMQLQETELYIAPFGFCDVWDCEDCSHITALDWRYD